MMIEAFDCGDGLVVVVVQTRVAYAKFQTKWCVMIIMKDYKHSLSGLELRYTMCLDVSCYYC